LRLIALLSRASSTRNLYQIPGRALQLLVRGVRVALIALNLPVLVELSVTFSLLAKRPPK
jgi:hypothetical protein